TGQSRGDYCCMTVNFASNFRVAVNGAHEIIYKGFRKYLTILTCTDASGILQEFTAVLQGHGPVE
ncbi:hypothetical protein JYT83_00460, partial [bacterium AH-315-F18]|nr:hypothetical protein [bacterium AH-315-F18]